MRQPKSWNDAELLEDEPFRSSFLAYSTAGADHRARSNIDVGLKEMAEHELDAAMGAAEAALVWAKLAFGSDFSHKTEPRKNIPNPDMRFTFVMFYWKLHQNDQAELFLRQEHKKRGYAYFLPLVETKSSTAKTLEKSSSRSLKPGKKTLPSSQRAAITAKNRILHHSAARSPPPKRPAKHASGTKGTRCSTRRAGFEGTLPTEPPKSLAQPPTASTAPRRNARRSKAPPVLQTRSSPCLDGHPNILGPSPHPNTSPSTETQSANRSSNLGGRKTGGRKTVDSLSTSASLGTVLYSKPSASLPGPSEPTASLMASSASGAPQSIPAISPQHRSITVKLAPSVRRQVRIESSRPQKPTPPFTSTPLAAHMPVSYKATLDIPLDNIERKKELATDLGLMQLFTPADLAGIVSDPAKKIQPFKAIDLTSQYKPPLESRPPIWSQSRQEVCESFDWFRSYQSGVYHTHGIVKGYLLSAFSSCRDRFEHGGRLIISHGGGKAESIHSRRGQSTTEPADDQVAEDKSVRALLKNYRESRPLVLLIDDRYALFPYDLGATDITYAVLGFYTIAHVWAEFQPASNQRGRVVRYKFAFQWCSGQGEPWWLPAPREEAMVVDMPPIQPILQRSYTSSGLLQDNSTLPLRPNDLYFDCAHCHTSTPMVYQEGWVCLNATCTRFWILNESPFPFVLNYNPDFLRLSHAYLLPPNIRDIYPSQPKSSPDSINTTYAFSRGWHCRACGRLSCRYKWEHWECLNCQAIMGFAGKIRSAKEFWTQKVPTSYLDHSISHVSGIKQEPSRLFSHERGMGQTQTFILPDGRGFIHHIQAGTPPGNFDADIIFKEYQEHASTGKLAFRRWPMRSHKCRGPLLTNYFSQNSGEPYQYVGGSANTVPFNKASSAVTHARQLIQRRIQQALGCSSSFNEVLSAAYMERQKMAFHSDSEPGLGPMVAGLSLGAPALMHFRVRAKYQVDAQPERKAIDITFILRHGDVLVMDGAGVQEYYEHTVVPTNFRIAATARSIRPTNLKAEMH